jgi:hypothetical protein
LLALRTDRTRLAVFAVLYFVLHFLELGPRHFNHFGAQPRHFGLESRDDCRLLGFG